MVILGIDPGSRIAGYGILKLGNGDDVGYVSSGIIDVRSQESMPYRLADLRRQLVEIIEKWRPAALSIEKIFLGKSADSAFILGQARGVCLAIAGEYDIPVFEYATRFVKKVVTGRGGAEKEEVQAIMQALLGRRFHSLDETDSLALALCHCRQMQVSALIEQAAEKGLKGVPL